VKKAMTVQDLIDVLNTVEDKSALVGKLLLRQEGNMDVPPVPQRLKVLTDVNLFETTVSDWEGSTEAGYDIPTKYEPVKYVELEYDLLWKNSLKK
jgi:hypothetical protein